MRSYLTVVAEELFLYSSLYRLLQSKKHQSKAETTHLILIVWLVLNVLRIISTRSAKLRLSETQKLSKIAETDMLKFAGSKDKFYL